MGIAVAVYSSVPTTKVVITGTLYSSVPTVEENVTGAIYSSVSTVEVAILWHYIQLNSHSGGRQYLHCIQECFHV